MPAAKVCVWLINSCFGTISQELGKRPAMINIIVE